MPPSMEPKVFVAAMQSRFAGRPHWEFWLAMHVWTRTPDDGTAWHTTLGELVDACRYMAGARPEGPDATMISRFLDRLTEDGERRGWRVVKATLPGREGLAISRVNRRTKRQPPGETETANARPPQGPTMKDFTDYFCACWAKAHPSAVAPYPFAAGKDGTAAARVWRHVGQDLAKARQIVDAFFACDEPFYADDQTISKMAYGLAKWVGGNGQAIAPGPAPAPRRPRPTLPPTDAECRAAGSPEPYFRWLDGDPRDPRPDGHDPRKFHEWKRRRETALGVPERL